MLFVEVEVEPGIYQSRINMKRSVESEKSNSSITTSSFNSSFKGPALVGIILLIFLLYYFYNVILGQFLTGRFEESHKSQTGNF